MRLTLANKVSISVVGVCLLAIASSLAAVLSTHHIGQLMQQTIGENLASMLAAEELEIALLEQRGFVSYYLLSAGDRKWLLELDKRKKSLEEGFQRARGTAHSPEEHEILDRLEKVYRSYDAKRDEVVSLVEKDKARAAKLLVEDVNDLQEQSWRLCEDFIAANQRYIDDRLEDATRQIRWVTLAVTGCVALTIGLGASLLWLFFSGVFLPLRAMIADARGFAGANGPEESGLPSDELRAVGIYLRNLMSDVADARTTLERSRRQLLDAERLASVGKLAASVAHEIRNPLTAMKMWLFSIRKDTRGDAALDRKFDIVAEEVRRLERIVRDFLEFSRPPALRLRAESIGAVLDGALALAEPQMLNRRIQLLREESRDVPPVLADAEQLRQVLINLINNAVEAMGEGGWLRVGASTEPESSGGSAVVVRVSDSGPGMPPSVQKRIFEPFFSTKEQGTGLGLCIAARIMAGHAGRLVLESSNEEGTTFALHIPLAGPAEHP